LDHHQKFKAMPPARIFIVDDDGDDLALFGDMLTAQGLDQHVLFFDDARTVLSYLAGLHPDDLPSLILSDLNMPGLSGLGLIRKLDDMDLLGSITIVIFSTSNHPHDMEQCLRAGAKTYLKKPVEYTGYQNIVDCLKRYLQGEEVI
jgi:CheY-like chemotaxis protein